MRHLLHRFHPENDKEYNYIMFENHNSIKSIFISRIQFDSAEKPKACC